MSEEILLVHVRHGTAERSAFGPEEHRLPLRILFNVRFTPAEGRQDMIGKVELLSVLHRPPAGLVHIDRGTFTAVQHLRERNAGGVADES